MARERQLRKSVRPKRVELEHLDARPWALVVPRTGTIGDTDHARRPAFGDVIHAEQARYLDLGSDLLAALTPGRVRRVLVVVHKASGQAPEPLAWLDRAAAEQHTVSHLDDDRRDHLGVVPEDEVIVGAGLEDAALDDTRRELRAAVDAVVAHRPKQ